MMYCQEISLVGLLKLINGIHERMPNILHRKMMFLFVKIFLERQNHIHVIDIAFNRFDTVFFPCPNLWRNIIMRVKTLLFCPFGNSHIESGIIDKNYRIWMELFDVFFTKFDVIENG